MSKIVQDQILANLSAEMRDPLMQVLQESKQYDVRYKSVDQRNLTDTSGHQLIDFASCNYLGFDQLQSKLLDSGVEAANKYGLHTSRARLMGYYDYFTELESRLAEFLGLDEAVLFPNTTLSHIGIIPAIMKKDDVIFLDKSAHATMYQASQIARDKGTKLVSFPQENFEVLSDLLRKHKNAERKMICVDGVYSMTGDYAALDQLVPLAKEYDALIYIDDAHGFGFVGENPTEEMPYGVKGNGIVKHFNQSYDNIMYVAGTGKNFSAAAAVVGVTTQMKNYLMAYAKPLDYTHPSTPFALGILDAALTLQLEQGDELRKRVYHHTRRLVEGLREMDLTVMTKTYFPIISVLAGNTDKLIQASRMMYEKGVFLTSCPYPTMPKGQEALRITLTANHTDDQISHLLEVFHSLKDLLVDHSVIA